MLLLAVVVAVVVVVVAVLVIVVVIVVVVPIRMDLAFTAWVVVLSPSCPPLPLSYALCSPS